MVRSWRCTALCRHPPSCQCRTRTYIWVCWSIYWESQCPNSNRSSTTVRWPESVRHADDSERWRDEELASMLSKIEIMVLNLARVVIHKGGIRRPRTFWDIQNSESRMCSAQPSTRGSCSSNWSNPSSGWVIFMEAMGWNSQAGVGGFAIIWRCVEKLSAIHDERTYLTMLLDDNAVQFSIISIISSTPANSK